MRDSVQSRTVRQKTIAWAEAFVHKDAQYTLPSHLKCSRGCLVRARILKSP
jgi:hypothetical protein